jgi:hypothetical protein
MKFLVIALCAAYSLLGQQASKVDPNSLSRTVETKASERPLSEAEVLKFQLLGAKMQILADKFKITEYQTELQPLSAEQQNLTVEKCASVGVTPDKIQTECGIDLGLGPDGKQRLGPDNKPVAAHVWKVQAAAPPVKTPDSTEKK